MEIESRALTTCEVTNDGRDILLGLIDGAGVASHVRMPVDQIGALAMTLPRLIEKALRLRYRDASLRYTFPLGSWNLEQSTDPDVCMVTLRTPDGFSVCFAVPRSETAALGEALSAQPGPHPPFRAN